MKIFVDFVKEHSDTVGERNEFDDITEMVLFIQSILGQQVLHPKWSWRSTAFNHIYVISLTIYVLFGTAEMIKTVDDVTFKGEAMYTLLLTVVFILRYWLHLIYRDSFVKAYLMIKINLFGIIKTTSTEITYDVIKKLKLIVKFFYFTVAVPVSMYIAMAIWFNAHGERVTLSPTTSILMPMTSPYFEIGFALHVIFLSLMAFSICVFDVWFVVLMFAFCMTCDCLLEILKVEPKTADESEMEYALRLNDRLRRYYICHEQLMEYLNLSMDMYKWAAAIPLISVVGAICLLMFLMTETMKWNFMTNLLPPLVQIIAYNWFGEHVKYKQSQLRKTFLCFDWCSMRLADKKSYLIILTYMNREHAIKTAYGRDLSFNTLTDVIKASYQAYTLLKTMKV